MAVQEGAFPAEISSTDPGPSMSNPHPASHADPLASAVVTEAHTLTPVVTTLLPLSPARSYSSIPQVNPVGSSRFHRGPAGWAALPRPRHLPQGSGTAQGSSLQEWFSTFIASTDACVFSLGNVNICIPNSSLQILVTS